MFKWVFRSCLAAWYDLGNGELMVSYKCCGCLGPERVPGYGRVGMCAKIFWEAVRMWFGELWWWFGVV